jgi:hypothetical protein
MRLGGESDEAHDLEKDQYSSWHTVATTACMTVSKRQERLATAAEPA